MTRRDDRGVARHDDRGVARQDDRGVARRDDRGVTLLFVLVILALCSAVVVAMVTVSESSVRRTRMHDEAVAAGALVAAGEATAVIALRRDLITSPDLDHANEAWARTNQAEVAIAGGQFSLTLTDAQGLYNLTNLGTEGVLAQQRLTDILTALDLKADLRGRIIAAAPTRLGALRAVMTAEDLAKLATMVTILPQATEVNVNAAPAALLGVLLNNTVQARLLVARRAKLGFLTPDDVAGLGIILPAGVVYRSSFFDVTVTAQVGETVVTGQALIARQMQAGGEPRAAVVARSGGKMAAELPLPP